MANYGNAAYGVAGLYDSTCDYTPSATELLGALNHYFGRDGWQPGRHRSVYKPPEEEALEAWTQIVGGGATVIAALTADVATGGLGVVATSAAVVGGSLEVMSGIQTLTELGTEIVPMPEGSPMGDTWHYANQGKTFLDSGGGVPDGGWDALVAWIKEVLMHDPFDAPDTSGDVSAVSLESVLANLWGWMEFEMMNGGIPLLDNPDFRVLPIAFRTQFAEIPSWGTYLANPMPFPILAEEIEPTDTVLSYLQREQSDFAWTQQGPVGLSFLTNSNSVYAPVGSEFMLWYRCMLTDAMLQERRLQSNAASLWPGADGVTLGTPIAVLASGQFDAVCNGCLLTVDALPPGQGRQHAGPLTRYPYVGWLVFLDADDNADVLQRIELDKSVYVPHTMSSAAAIAINAKPGLNVTITPWSLAG